MAISTMDGVVAGYGASHQYIPFYTLGVSASGNGVHNLHRYGTPAQWGMPSAPTAYSSGGEVPTDATYGYPTLTNPPVGQSLYLAGCTVHSSIWGVTSIYDRVWAAGSFSGSVTTAQTVSGAVAIPSARCPSNGEGLEIWLEGYSATGGSNPSATINYTNSSGVSSRSATVTLLSGMPTGRMVAATLQAGDTGVQSVQSLTLSGSTGAAGNIAVILMKRKVMVPHPTQYLGSMLDFASTGLVPLDAASCLQVMFYSGTSSSLSTVLGAISVIAG
jgi:hypothetical protein